MHRISTLFFTILILIFSVFVAVKNITLDREVVGHLKHAADANNTEMAERKLALAVKGMKARGLCNDEGQDCYTSILYRTPDEDIGYWRENIENTLQDLVEMTPEERANNLIESNQLIKVRETLLDSNQYGDYATIPPGLARYPHNTPFALAFWFLIIGFFVSCGRWLWVEARY